MRINCIACGHRFELDDAYDDYSGLVKCSICRSLLQIASEGGRLRSVDLHTVPAVQPTPERKAPPRKTEAA